MFMRQKLKPSAPPKLLLHLTGNTQSVSRAGKPWEGQTLSLSHTCMCTCCTQITHMGSGQMDAMGSFRFYDSTDRHQAERDVLVSLKRPGWEEQSAEINDGCPYKAGPSLVFKLRKWLIPNIFLFIYPLKSLQECISRSVIVQSRHIWMSSAHE